MTFQDKLFELANRLLVGTGDGAIKWSETADEDSFRAVLNSGLVRIERGPLLEPERWDPRTPANSSEKSTEPLEYSLLVLDERNKELGRYVANSPERRLTLRNLWEVAGRSAKNADQKIDSLLQEVENRVKQR
jgi:hypothetical protein